jgi:hypothetical protein
MKTLIILLGAILLIGCTPKKPVELENNPFATVNQSMFTKHKNIVPLDTAYQEKYYGYRLKVRKERGEYFKNTQVVKSFYLMHHADKITIIGSNTATKGYRNYLRTHGVRCQIEIIKKYIPGNYVWIDILHSKKGD